VNFVANYGETNDFVNFVVNSRCFACPRGLLRHHEPVKDRGRIGGIVCWVFAGVLASPAAAADFEVVRVGPEKLLYGVKSG